MKLLEKIIYLEYALFFRFCLSVHFEPLLGWECACVCHDLWTEKQGIYAKKREYKTNSCHISDPSSWKRSFKSRIFLLKSDYFPKDLRVQFESPSGWEFASVCHDLRTEKQGIYAKRQEHERSNWYTTDLHLGK